MHLNAEPTQTVSGVQEDIEEKSEQTLSRTQMFGKYLLEREKVPADPTDKTYRMLKLNTFLTAAVLAILGSEDSYDLLMTMIWFI
jgi:hypothetical protein